MTSRLSSLFDVADDVYAANSNRRLKQMFPINLVF